MRSGRLFILAMLLTMFALVAQGSQVTLTEAGIGGGGAPVVPCGNGQLDFSTGCGTIWYMLVLS